MISVICCSNRLDVYESMLKKSALLQYESYELILLDNTHNQFSSASKAYNHGIKKAQGDVLVFAHQDIQFEDPNLFFKIREAVEETKGLVGVAGIRDKTGVMTNLIQGEYKSYGGPIQLNRIEKVQTLDEVLFAGSRSTFETIAFDEVTCDDWHLYAVDLCLSAALKGIDAYVIPEPIFHKSQGKISLGYARTLWRLIQKHRSNYRFIYTTCSIVSTKRLRSIQYVLQLIWDHVIVGRN